jgi:hypothetical protein
MRLADMKGRTLHPLWDVALAAVRGDVAALSVGVEFKSMKRAHKPVLGDLAAAQGRAQMGAAVIVDARNPIGRPPEDQLLPQAFASDGMAADFSAFQKGVPLVLDQVHVFDCAPF